MEDTMDNQQTNHDIIWISSLIECEGSIGFMAQNYNPKENRVDRIVPQICITNSDLALLDKAIDIIKRVGIGYHISESRSWTKKKVWDIRILGFKRCKPLLDLIYPFLVGEKRIKAKAVIDYTEDALIEWEKRKKDFPTWRINRLKGRISTHYIPTEKKLMYLRKCRESFRDYTPVLRHIKS